MRVNRPWQSVFTGNPGTLTPPANGSWTVPDWWVDPSNSSGVASDSNVGNSSASPLLSYREIVRRWQTTQPILRQTTTIHFMSSHLDDSDPVIGAPWCVQGSCSLVGVLPAAAATGTISALAAQVRSGAGNFWNATFPAGTGWGVGSLIVNATRGNSRAFVYSPPGGEMANTVFTQPRNPVGALPFTTAVPTRVDTWANGDTVNIYNLFKINVEWWKPALLDFNATANISAIWQLEIQDFGPFAGFDQCFIGPGCAQLELYAHKPRLCDVFGLVATFHVNVLQDVYTLFNPGFPGTSGNLQLFSGGYLDQLIFNNFGSFIDGDVIVTNVNGEGGTWGLVAFDNSTGGHLVRVEGPQLVCKALTDGSAILWSPNGGVFDNSGRCRCQFPTGAGTAATTFPGLTLKLNGVTTANAYDDTADPGLWHPGRNLTVANLDADVAAGGFRSNGIARAIDPAGACFISAGTVQ